jgi:murein DD-endopeptidase MepM/ murein hydrolase activator NlpD
MHNGGRGITDLFLILFVMAFYCQYERIYLQRRLMLETLDGIGGGSEIEVPTNREQMTESKIERHGLLLYHWIYPEIAYPVMDPANAFISSERGPRYITGWEMHDGIDIVSRFDYRVIAGMDGTADLGDNRIFGNYVTISGVKVLLQYSHLSKVMVGPGKPVKRGEVIGLIGNTGRTFGRPHLDFMIWIDGQLVNPVSNSTYRKEVFN